MTVEPTDWRRLDTRMLLVNPVQELIRFFPLVIGAFVVGSSDGQEFWQLLGLAIPITIGVVRFLITRFRITDTQVELRRGLVGQTVTRARLDRVRTVELTSSPIHRVLGLAKVEIGTGSAAKELEEKFALDALAVAEAQDLRTALLHRARATAGDAVVSHEGPGPVGSTAAPGIAEPSVAVETPAETAQDTAEEVLLRLDPRWVRYAPFTASGSVVAAAVMALVGQFGEQLFGRFVDEDAVLDALEQVSIALGITILVGGFLVLGAVFAVLGYLVTNWGFALSRDVLGRSFHVRRGLLTSTETSMETARIRGVEIGEPLTLRLAGAGRALAIVTGLSSSETASRVVVPPAPIEVVRSAGVQVLGDATPVLVQLTMHGPAARRRRFTRALLGATALPALGAVAALATPLDWWVAVPLLLAYPLALALAEDRYRRLGHALTTDHLVVRSGGVTGRRDMLQRGGIISWNIQQSWFQRRLGLVHLVATTAAGGQAYVARDIPEGAALRLAREAVPGLLDDFTVAP